MIFLTESQWAQCSVGSETCLAQGEGFGPPGWSTNFSMLIFLPAGSEVLPIWKFLDKRPFNPQLPFSKIHSPMKSGMPRNNKIVGKAHAIPLCLHSATHISFNWSLFLTYIQYTNEIKQTQAFADYSEPHPEQFVQHLWCLLEELSVRQ